MDYSGYRTPDCLRREPKEVQDFYVLMVEKDCVWRRVKEGLVRLSSMMPIVFPRAAGVRRVRHNKKGRLATTFLRNLVGVRGFEPPTPTSRT